MNKENPTQIQSPEVCVVEASAGSGKTYALAKRFLQLLITKTARPENVQNILAVTFTNKASRKMKERILKYLKDIALSTEDSKEILSYLSIEPLEAKQKASHLMDYIIQNYNFFQVQTIDSFINTILSGCAYNLKLSANFEIKKDPESFLVFALDKYIDTADHDPKTRKIFDKFLSQYIYIENKFNWLPKNDIYKIIKSMLEGIALYGSNFIKFNLRGTDILKEKKKILSSYDRIFEKLPDGIYEKFIGSLRTFISENQDNFDFSEISKRTYLFSEQIPIKKGFKTPKMLDKQWKMLQSHISSIADKEAFSLFNPYIDIFEPVYKDFRQYANSEDVLFLNELNKLAHSLLGKDNISVPELYYRLATRYKHYLIDEFQDTNLLQWQNMVTMVEDALSAGGTLFYVGDKKQAIFRFRGGETYLFDKIKNDFSEYNVKSENLNINYRSQKEIIDFVNSVFSENNIRNFLQSLRSPDDSTFSTEDVNEILHVFKDAKQYPAKDKNLGYVKGEIIQYTDSEEKDKIINNKIISLIRDLKTRFDSKSIAVLARTNNEVEQISSWLIGKGIAVESEKTLNIRNNQFIKELISFFKFLHSPIDNLSFASFILGDIFSLATGKSKNEFEDFLLNQRNSAQKHKASYIYREFRKTYPDIWESYVEIFFKNVGFIKLYELTVDIFQQLKILNNFPQYYGFFSHFFELIKKNENEYQDLGDFLEYFTNAPENDLYVNCSDTDAIKVMTIHKAKGLEFKAVVIPYMEFNLTGNKKSNAPYTTIQDENGLLLVSTQSKYNKLSNNIKIICRDEYKKSFIDELNSIYVALTRAADEMHFFIPCKISKIDNFAKFLIPGNFLEKGVKTNSRKQAQEDTEMVKISPPEYNNWINFLKDEFIDLNRIKYRHQILTGEILHCILSSIENLIDADKEAILAKAIEKAQIMFPYIPDFSKHETIVRNLIENKTARIFFYADNCMIYNEKEIVDRYGKAKRMDRVMVSEREVWIIDYKSKGDVTLDHKKQLLEYIKLIQEIYPDKIIKAFIIFMEDARIEGINPATYKRDGI